MKLEYLLSFQKNEELQDLDSETLKVFSSLFLKNFNKKAKKKIIKPTTSILKNQKIQLSKDKTENKVNLLLNKLSKNNFDNITTEFIKTFQEIDYNDYKKIIEVFYTKIIKDEKFFSMFFKFFIKISNIYNHFFGFTIEYFFNILEKKTKYDYSNVELDPEFSFLLKLDKEENRINNLKLIILLIDNKVLDFKIIPEVSKTLMDTNNIPDIYTWFSNRIINKIDNIKNYNDNLVNKLNEDINNRYIVLLKNLLDSNDIDYESESEESIIEPEFENEDDKSDYEIAIENIIEEYLLLEDFEEIEFFVNENKNIDIDSKILTDNIIKIYFNKNLSSFDKFKNLFVNIKKNKIIENDVLKKSLTEILESDFSDDVNNFDVKIKKLTEIFKIIQVKISKNILQNNNHKVV